MNCASRFNEGSVGLSVLLKQTVPKLGQLTGQDFRDDLQELFVEQEKSDPDLDQQVGGDP